MDTVPILSVALRTNAAPHHTGRMRTQGVCVTLLRGVCVCACACACVRAYYLRGYIRKQIMIMLCSYGALWGNNDDDIHAMCVLAYALRG